MGDRVAVLKDGLLQQVDSPRNMYDRPANLFVAGFIGSPAMNLVEVPITDGGVKFGNSVVPVAREALSAAADRGDSTVTVGVRPEHFDIVSTAAAGQALSKAPRAGRSGRLRQRRRGARRRRLRLRHRAGRWRAQGPGGPRLRPRRPGEGHGVHVVPRPEETHVFSTSTGERLSD